MVNADRSGGAQSAEAPVLFISVNPSLLCNDLYFHQRKQFIYICRLGQLGALPADGTGRAGHGIAEHFFGVQALAQGIACLLYTSLSGEYWRIG